MQTNISTGFFGKGFGFNRGFNGRGFGKGWNGGNGGVVPYAYPVYVGGFGYGYGGSFDSPYPSGYVPGDTSQQQAPPNVTVVYPPQPAPVIINQFGPGGAAQPPAAATAPEQAPVTENTAPADSGDQTAPTRYLIAFKDHTVYSAIAYWVDGDTLHYFTSGNTHNQASLSLVDRELTDRLNKESGVQFSLPPVKAAQ